MKKKKVRNWKNKANKNNFLKKMKINLKLKKEEIKELNTITTPKLDIKYPKERVYIAYTQMIGRLFFEVETIAKYLSLYFMVDIDQLEITDIEISVPLDEDSIIIEYKTLVYEGTMAYIIKDVKIENTYV